MGHRSSGPRRSWGGVRLAIPCIHPPAGESHLSNGLDPVAETAIRQLTEPSGRAAKKTPTKRSTLIISGVSKVTGLWGEELGWGENPHWSLLPIKICPSCQVPIAQDELALSLGYAASLEASMQDDAGPSGGPSSPPSDPPAMSPGPLDALSSPTSVQEADETTRSDISERPSVDDVESETGSTGALETRSLKDHKGGEILAAPPFLLYPVSSPGSHWTLRDIGASGQSPPCSPKGSQSSQPVSAKLE